MTHLIWLLPIIMVAVIIAAMRYKQTSTRVKIGVPIAIVVAGLLVWLGWWFFTRPPAKPAADKPAATQSAPVRIPSSSPSKRLLPFDEKGSTILFEFKGVGPLLWKAEGGKVTIHSLADGRTWTDYPGKRDFGYILKGGWYVATKEPTSSATGVEITQIW